MKNKKLVFVLIGFIALFVISFVAYNYLNSKYNKENKNSTDITEDNKDSTEQAKDFVVYDKNLNQVKLSDYKGKPVVVNFWASWCPPCRSEMPTFNEISSKYSQDNLVILMVNLTDGERETMDTANQFIKNNNYNMNVLFDNDNSAAINYNILSIPRTIFIDKNGNIVKDHSGVISKDELESEINEILK